MVNGDWESPDGFYSIQDDESGQCYPDTESCYPGHFSSPDTTNCSDEEWICKEFNITGLSLVEWDSRFCEHISARRRHVQTANFGGDSTTATIIW